MLNFFGKKRRRSVKKGKKSRKPPARLIKLCKKYRIKVTKKVGKKRIYKSVTVIKKQLKRKMKNKKSHSRRSQFGKFNFGDTNKIENVKHIYNVCFPQIPKSSLDQIITDIKRSSYEHFEKEIFNARNNNVALSTLRLQMHIKQYLENKLTYAQLLNASERLTTLLTEHNGRIKVKIDRQYHREPTGKYKPGALRRIIEFGKRH
jgi:uncharacterized FlgJ-related protein